MTTIIDFLELLNCYPNIATHSSMTCCQNNINPYQQYLTAMKLLNDQSIVNKNNALKFLEAAAPFSDQAAYELAGIQATGIYFNGVIEQKIDAKDPNRAFYWCTIAANNGWLPAQTLLATFYSNGIGVTHNREKAIVWFALAASKGDPDALYVMANIYHYGTDTIAIDEKQAIYYYTESYKGGQIDATFVLAGFYERGNGVDKNISQARYLYSIVAEKGYTEAREKMDECTELLNSRDAINFYCLI